MPSLTRLRRLAVRRRASPWPPAPPDWIGIGAQRSGTTWWQTLIESHPDVHPLVPKETHYFDGFWDTDFDQSDAFRYHHLFARPEGRLCGEWTPRYMNDPWVPPLIHFAAPNAKILVLLRDPVERLRSALAYGQQRRLEQNVEFVSEAIGRGLYGMQLRHVLRYISAEKLLVLQFERCRDHPRPILTQTFAFLGLEPYDVPEALIRKSVNRTRSQVTLGADLRSAIQAAYEPDQSLLVSLFPSIDLGLWGQQLR